MERECCLSMLIALFGGTALLACGWWPTAHARAGSARLLERIAWRRVWLPLVPALAAAGWLCGWALAEPDPVPERVPVSIVLMSVPFALLLARTAIRACWSLTADQGDPGTATVGLLRPWILFSPHLAKTLDDRKIEAALEHERAHARHRDPLRIWLAQLASDLQWPWPQAHARLRRWLLALELARDEEARAAGIEGSALADAILASIRFDQRVNRPLQAALIGDPSALKERVTRLLDPLPANSEETPAGARAAFFIVAPALLLALALGTIFGERVIRALFWLAS